MSFLSELKVFGTKVEEAFAWFGSPKGQAVVSTVEAGVVAVAPQTAPIVGLFNVWAARAYNVESIAVAAAKSAGSGPDKAAAVISAVTPDILQYAQGQGLSTRTATQIKQANDAVVAFINAMTTPAA